MSEPLVVLIPHRHGKAEALRRIQDGLGQVKSHFAGRMAVVDERWNDNRLDFSVKVLGQTTVGAIDVGEEQVRLEVTLPWLLAKLANKAKALIQNQGKLLLEKR
jgi:hypothetical protein